jgi:hypothetical protein
MEGAGVTDDAMIDKLNVALTDMHHMTALAIQQRIRAEETARAAYAAGWRAGAEKMREACAGFLRDAAQDQYASAYDARERREGAAASDHVMLADSYSMHADGIVWLLLPPVEYPEAARDE